ncbi:hypothetical protein ACE1B6_24005 [Aerosakkonemataceae cyanobacterium BLCC-F154]|uniref:Uncharacterized protein n=1 Tax=Floridaenema fluviatile BLCC-F154 TaxID=3153640 RepID=A0ABV4YHS6_9CYAN
MRMVILFLEMVCPYLTGHANWLTRVLPCFLGNFMKADLSQQWKNTDGLFPDPTEHKNRIME